MEQQKGQWKTEGAAEARRGSEGQRKGQQKEAEGSRRQQRQQKAAEGSRRQQKEGRKIITCLDQKIAIPKLVSEACFGLPSLGEVGHLALYPAH
jgi:hypothetical protein